MFHYSNRVCKQVFILKYLCLNFETKSVLILLNRCPSNLSWTFLT